MRKIIEAKLKNAVEQIAIWQNNLTQTQAQVAVWQGMAQMCRELLAESEHEGDHEDMKKYEGHEDETDTAN